MTKSQREIVGANVRAEMARRNVRQGALAKALGISQPSVSARLSGAVPFDVDELRAVADLLGVGMCGLLDEAPAVAS